MEPYAAGAHAWLAAFGADARDAPLTAFAPQTVKQALDGALALGRAAGRLPAAMRAVAEVERRLAGIAGRLAVDRRTGTVGGAAPPSVAVVKLVDQRGLQVSGAWVPDLVALAGARPVVARAGGPDVNVVPATLLAAGPAVVVLALETAPLHAATDIGRRLASAWSAPGVRFVAVDGVRYVNVPGPALARSAELIAAAVHGAGAGVDASAAEMVDCGTSGNGTPEA